MILLPPLAQQAPIKDLERLWLGACCVYYVFDDNIMEDTVWADLSLELIERWEEWSPYFKEALPASVLMEPASLIPSAHAIDWDKRLSVAKLSKEAFRMDFARRVDKLIRMCNRDPSLTSPA